MHKNLKHYIQSLDAAGELRRVSVLVDTQEEISEIVDRVSKSDGGGPALLFDNTGSSFPLLINMFGSERRIAMALGVDDVDHIAPEIASLFASIQHPRTSLFKKLLLLRGVSSWMPRRCRGRGECQQVVDMSVDLGTLPILKTWPADGGRFVTLPLVHTLDEETGALNVGMYRMQVLSPTSTGMHWHRHKTGARHYRQWLAAGKRMPVTVTLGGDPAYTYAATAPLPDGINEYILAGFLRKKAVKMVKCITNSIYVPSDCDFVLEGYVDPTEANVVEGPFGDHTGFYSLEDLYPTFHVTCITHRRDAIYPATVVGVPPMEDRYIALATEKIFIEPIRAAIAPEVRSMTMPWQGVAHNLAIVEIEKSYEGQGFKVASALWGAGQMAFCKYIIITQSGWRFDDSGPNGAKIYGEILFSQGIADVLDHAGEKVGQSGKMCIDTTSQSGSWWTIAVTYDHGVEHLCDSEKLWIALANSDPSRDVSLQGDTINIDARSKQLSSRNFPNIVTMSDRTIEKVDRRWAEYNIGEFIASPSLRYKKLITGDGATKINAKTSNH